MYSSTFPMMVLIGVSKLVAGIQLQDINGTFVEHQVQHSNGSTVNIYLRDSYKHSQDSSDTLDKRFYKTYHSSTHIEICAETNYTENSGPDSALNEDCSAISADLKANPGYFETGDYSGNDYNCLAVCGTCAIGVYRADGLSSRVDIGSKDVIDNIDVSIVSFSRGGHIGVTGSFTCNLIPINWAIMRAP